MKTAISLPDDLFVAAEKIQLRKRVSRSEFYAMAIRWFVQHETNNGITEQLNKVYSVGSDKISDHMMWVQMDAIGKDDWK